MYNLAAYIAPAAAASHLVKILFSRAHRIRRDKLFMSARALTVYKYRRARSIYIRNILYICTRAHIPLVFTSFTTLFSLIRAVATYIIYTRKHTFSANKRIYTLHIIYYDFFILLGACTLSLSLLLSSKLYFSPLARVISSLSLSRRAIFHFPTLAPDAPRAPRHPYTAH